MDCVEILENGRLPYEVGALLYTPGNNKSIAEAVVGNKFDCPYSLSLCLEDSISDKGVEEAERILVASMDQINCMIGNKEFFLPKIFIRVRNPEQIGRLFYALKESRRLLTGFIFPKFSVENADAYIKEILAINKDVDKKIYMMPIIESQDLFHLQTRRNFLYQIKEKIDAVKEYVLNVRVGGNDFCKTLGVRRHADELIYDIAPVCQMLSDILTCFSMDYVVSGPVWEYFDGKDERWRKGFIRELRRDRLNGFIGKTVIHPNHISVANQCFMVP